MDLATYSHDLWLSGRGHAFFGTLMRLPNVRWLHMFAAGMDSPVFAELRNRGIRLTNSPGATARPIAHSVMMHVIALCRNARRFADFQHRHEWARTDIRNEDLEGRTMGTTYHIRYVADPATATASNSQNRPSRRCWNCAD